MATVPQYEIGQVRDRAVSGGFQQIQTNPDAFGAGIAQANINQGQVLSQLGDQAWQQAFQQRDKQDQATLRERDNLLTTRIRELLSDPDGYLSLSGRAAVESRQSIEKQLEDYMKELAKDLDPRILDQYKQFANQRINTAFNTIASHARSETDAWNADARTARIANQIQNVGANYNNPKQIQTELQLGIREVDSQLKDVYGIDVNNPKDDDEKAMINMARQEFTTKAHESVIANLLANDRYIGARTYFEENKSQITAANHATIENSLKTHTIKGRMLEAADEILTKANNITDQLALAAELPDDIRESVESRIKSHWQTQNAIKNNEEIEAANTVAGYMSEGANSKADIDARDPDLWEKLSGGEQDRLIQLFKAREDKAQLEIEEDAYNTALGHVVAGTQVPDSVMSAMRGDQLLNLEKEVRSMATNEENDAYDEVLRHFAAGGTKEELMEGPRNSQMKKMWNDMSGAHQLLINNNIATAQEKIDTEEKKLVAQTTFMELEELSRTQPEVFRAIDLQQYVGIVDNADLNSLTAAQNSPGGIQLLQSRIDLIKSVMGAMGHDYKDMDHETKGVQERAIMGAINNKLLMFFERNNREANDQEFTQIVLSVRDDMVFRKDTLMGIDWLNPDEEVSMFEVNADDMENIYVIIDGEKFFSKDIPLEERKDIIDGLNQLNLPVTERKIIEIYKKINTE